MADLCPHCGATLPTFRDAYCPECREPLPEPGEAPKATAPPSPPVVSTAPLVVGPKEKKPVNVRNSLPSVSTPPLFSNVFFATPQTMLNLWKFHVADSQGTLHPAAKGFRFVGRTQQLTIQRVTAIQWSQASLCLSGIGSLFLGFVFVLLLNHIMDSRSLPLNNPVNYMLVVIFVGCIGFVIPWHWVRVDYLDEHGQPGTAYFTPASPLARWAGALKSLYNRLHAFLDQTKQPPPASEERIKP